MDIKHLKLVREIADHGTLSKASEKLFLTQSALSHQLREIEYQVGVPVFLRINKKMVITDAGNILLNSANRILDEFEKVELELKKLRVGDQGSLAICTECYTCYHWLPPIIKKFNSQFPNIDVSINSDNEKKPLELLLAGKLEIAIVHRLIKDNNLTFSELFTDEFVAIIPTSHPLYEKNFLVAEDFSDQKLIMHSKKYLQTTLFEKVLTPAGITPQKILYVQLTEAAIEMVKSGLGITVMAKWLARPYLENRKLGIKKITKSGLKRKWHAATLKQLRRSSYVPAFIDLLVNEIEI